MNQESHAQSVDEVLNELRLEVHRARLEGWDLGMRQAALMVKGKSLALRGTRGPVSPHLDSASRMILREAENRNDYDPPAPTFETQRKKHA